MILEHLMIYSPATAADESVKNKIEVLISNRLNHNMIDCILIMNFLYI
ncbi:hypothetical protein KIS4809_1381 [Bacillus sp. ZZV12-4809]|nr:hypothetical protein KIS4809_1381 [Bacillus sp. ZZV12-4809]